MNSSQAPEPRYKVHWHVLLTHFPLSLVGVALLFQLLHLYAYPQCFELASTVVLVAGVASLIPTTLTGYSAWQRQYHAANVPIFRRKVAIAVALLVVGIPLSLWRISYIGVSPAAKHPGIHWPYFIGIAFVCVGAIPEGYYGGRLSHRPRTQFQKHNNTG